VNAFVIAAKTVGSVVEQLANVAVNFHNHAKLVQNDVHKDAQIVLQNVVNFAKGLRIKIVLAVQKDAKKIVLSA